MFKRIFAFILGLLIQAQFGVVINPVYAATTEAECKTMAGKVWDGRLNACVTSAQTSKIQNQVKNACKDLTGEAYQNCYYNNALSALNDEGIQDGQSVQDFTGSAAGTSVALVASLMAAKYSILRKKTPETCTSASIYMMLGAGAAVLIGEVTSNLSYRKKLKNEIEDYEEKVKVYESDEEMSTQEKIEYSSNNQVRAFDFLINQEEHRTKLMKTRKLVYTGAAALYGGAVIVSALEAANIMNPTSSTCKKGASFESPELNKAKKNLTLLSQIFDDIKTGRKGRIIDLMIGIVGINSAHAQEVTKNFKNYREEDVVTEFSKILTAASISGAAAGGIVFSQFSKTTLDQVFTTAIGRGVYAGLLGGYSYKVMYDAKKAQEESEKRGEAIKEIRDGIANNTATIDGCTTQDKDDSSKPECYCYIEGSQKNTKRARQEVCKKQWGELDILNANNYNLNGGDTSSQSSCVNSAYKVDESCSCKKATGKDSCLSLSNPSGFNSIGAASWGNSIQDTANNLLSGGYGTGEVLENAGNNLAMMNKKIEDKLKGNKKVAAALKKIRNGTKKLDRSIANSMGPRLASSGYKSPFQAQNLDNLDPKKAAEEVAKEIAKSAEYESKANKTANTSNESGYDLDFGTSEGAGTTIEDVSEVMDKQFDYGDNDINNRPNDSIFKILTMRYQTSGLRRLFDEKNRFKAEEANASEIHGQQ